MTNKELVVKALTEAFVNGNVDVMDKYWADNYIQHNPQLPNGRDALKSLIAGGSGLKYEMSLVLAEGDFVMVHGRITGFGPKPVIAVDIFRIADGRLAEHWDVLQEEVAAENAVSKNAMFPINV